MTPSDIVLMQVAGLEEISATVILISTSLDHHKRTTISYNFRMMDIPLI